MHPDSSFDNPFVRTYFVRSPARSIPRLQTFFSCLSDSEPLPPRLRLKFTISRSLQFAVGRGRRGGGIDSAKIVYLVSRARARGRLAVRINTSREYICETVKSVSNFLSPAWRACYPNFSNIASRLGSSSRPGSSYPTERSNLARPPRDAPRFLIGPSFSVGMSARRSFSCKGSN